MLHENLLISQFKDSKYKGDIIKGFLNLNPDWGNMCPVYNIVRKT